MFPLCPAVLETLRNGNNMVRPKGVTMILGSYSTKHRCTDTWRADPALCTLGGRAEPARQAGLTGAWTAGSSTGEVLVRDPSQKFLLNSQVMGIATPTLSWKSQAH